MIRTLGPVDALLIGVSSHINDWHIDLSADFLARLYPILVAPQADVHEHQIEMFGSGNRHPFVSRIHRANDTKTQP